MTKEITYLASIYSTEFLHLKEARYNMACAACAFLKKEINIGVYSPIVHWHPTAILHNIIGDFHIWQEEDEKMIELLDSFTVLRSELWEKSKGLRHELLYAQMLKKPIKWLKVLSSVVDGEFYRFKLLD